MAIYTSKFAIDDEIWIVRRDSFRKLVECFPCDNTGKIDVRGESLICPKCSGRGKHEQYVGERLYVSNSGKVGQVRITDCPSDEGLTFDYMIDATGIGSGTIWKESDLFYTREEAEKHCDLENAKFD